LWIGDDDADRLRYAQRTGEDPSQVIFTGVSVYLTRPCGRCHEGIAIRQSTGKCGSVSFTPTSMLDVSERMKTMLAV
jgi:hypothetical protein